MNVATTTARPFSVWLLSRSGENERGWLVQACTGTEREFFRAGEAWQVPITSSGLQRMNSKWAQNDRPLLIFKVDASRTLGADDRQLLRWQICAPGSQWHNRLLKADERDIRELGVLAKMKMSALAVCEMNADTPDAGSPLQAPAGAVEPQLARLVLVKPGSVALSEQKAGTSNFLPSAGSLFLGVVIAGSCAATNLYLGPEHTRSSRSGSTDNTHLEQQLELACTPINPSNLVLTP